ncbi:phosphatidylinositol-4-phosphate 5-kinase [Musa troglodytarum]|uniref:Phosphatidylinositol-4-phosphate 5-kinase n=1 Tax=Musa troglodytarum TaxID=320322 RepID=A0A9E7FXB1_9LILI|nr:phosphatidylinositol-4-phosphate 5-kinase [Musa troglodytarum]URE04771.1 phosphatidylinositol-4-phosphate 5-kinase [Musa troglodytarum]
MDAFLFFFPPPPPPPPPRCLVCEHFSELPSEPSVRKRRKSFSLHRNLLPSSSQENDGGSLETGFDGEEVKCSRATNSSRLGSLKVRNI